MSLFKNTGGQVTSVIENDEVIISESDMVDLMTVAMMEGCSTTEVDEMIEEAGCKKSTSESSDDLEVLEERSIVKLDKNAKKNHAYSMATLQIAKEENLKEYHKLRKLWKLESVLMKKIEKRVKSKAERRAKELFKTMIKSKKPAVAKAGTRMLKTNIGGK